MKSTFRTSELFSGGTGVRWNWTAISMVFWLLVVLSSCPLGAQSALVNVTVERSAPEVVYLTGFEDDWREAWPGVRIAAKPGATATLTFEGVAVWYSGWLWTQQTSFLAFVDDLPDPVVLNVSDPDHVGDSLDAPSTPTKVVKILIARNLTESKHTVVLRKGDDQREVIVASFIYSTNNPPPSAPSSRSAPASSASSASSRGNSSNNLVVIIPSVVGSLVVIAAIVVLFLWLRRRRQERSARLVYPEGAEAPAAETITINAGTRTASKVSLTGAKRGVREDDIVPGVPSIPQVTSADLKVEYPNWRIE